MPKPHPTEDYCAHYVWEDGPEGMAYYLWEWTPHNVGSEKGNRWTQGSPRGESARGISKQAMAILKQYVAASDIGKFKKALPWSQSDSGYVWEAVARAGASGTRLTQPSLMGGMQPKKNSFTWIKRTMRANKLYPTRTGWKYRGEGGFYHGGFHGYHKTQGGDLPDMSGHLFVSEEMLRRIAREGGTVGVQRQIAWLAYNPHEAGKCIVAARKVVAELDEAKRKGYK